MNAVDTLTLARKVLDEIPHALFVVDPKGEVLFMNLSAKAFLRSTQPAFNIEKCFLLTTNPHWKYLIQNSLNVTTGHQTPSTFELDYRVDGKLYFFDVNCSPFAISNNEVQQVLVRVEDITVQKVYERKITQAANDLKEMITHANAIIIALDTSGNVIEWNDFASEVTGYSPSESVRKHYSELFSDAETDVVFSEILQATGAGRSLTNIEINLNNKDREKITILINATPRKTSQGEIVSSLIIGQEISKLTVHRKALEQKVRERTVALEAALEKERQLVEAKSRFAAIASHELRSPISVITSQIDQLKNILLASADTHVIAKLEKMSDMTKHMSILLEDILDLGKSEVGKIRPNIGSMDLRKFLEEIVLDIQSTNHTHHIVANYSFDSLVIESDRNLLRNIFVNLITNAIKFSPNKDKIFLDASVSGIVVQIIVRDNGIGIGQDDIENIFQPFSRGTNATGIKGTGLGLSIVKKSVESLKGRLWVESELEKGTTFTVQLNSIFEKNA